MTAPRDRLRADLLLVAGGHFESRARAQAAIAAGLVRADGVPVRRPSDVLARDAAVTAASPHPWVSRAGVKLAAALDAFGISPAGLRCLDVGASTGGFTNVMLARGAARVDAVDVGRGQLHPSLAGDPRLRSFEGTDARRLDGLIPPASVDLATVDVSFISLRLVLPALIPFLKNDAQLVALVKPQFEVGRDGVDRGGIVRDAGRREAGLAAILDLLPSLGLAATGRIPSPIAGGDGNLEVLIAARRHV